MEESLKWGIAIFAIIAGFAILKTQLFRSPRNSEFKMTLVGKQVVTHNTAIFKFSAPRNFQLPIGQHVVIFREVGDKRISRPYTPVAVGPGWLDLLIKVYRPNERFPAGGILSQYIDSLEIGSVVDARGPVGRMEYLGGGLIKFGDRLTKFRKIGMIAGGTGITPMYQVIQAAKNEAGIELSLLFANQSPSDILLREELEGLSKRCKVTLAVDKQPEGEWSGLTGYVDEAKISASLPPPSEEVAVLVCGPPAMTGICKDLLADLGYPHVFGL